MARVLVVDDDVDVRDAVHDWLTLHGHSVWVATSMSEALAILASVVLEVVLTDFAMVAHTGAELLRAVAAAHPTIYRILYTGSSDADLQDARATAHLVLRKGCDMNEITEAIAARIAP